MDVAQPVSVVLADPHHLTRAGLAAVLTQSPSIKVIGEAASTPELRRLVSELAPDVTVIADGLAGADSVRTVRQFLTSGSCPTTRYLLLGGPTQLAQYTSVLPNPARGLLAKDAHPVELLSAVLLVGRGHLVMPPRFADGLRGDPVARVRPALPSEGSPLTTLTRRETEVLRLLARGLANRQIAERLTVQESTVKSHVHSMLSKLSLRDRLHAVAFAHESGLVSPPVDGVRTARVRSVD